MTSPFPYTIHLNGNEPLVFLHPYPLNDIIWQEQIDLPFKVVTIDMTRGCLNDMESIAEGVIAILATENIDRASFCGCSFGGYVAYTIAKYFPHRAKSFIFTDTRASNDNEEQTAKRKDAIEKLEMFGIEAVSSVINGLVGHYTKENNFELLRYLNAMIASMPPSGLIALQKAMMTREDFTNFLPDISVPVTYICGAEDTVSSPMLMQEMANSTPNAQFHIIERAGHLPCIEQSDEFNNILLNHFYNMNL